MKYSYYPGCSLHSVAAEYEESTMESCKRLGIELEEVEGWTCCGASSAHSTNHLLGVAIPAHTLALAEDKGLDMVVPCAACYQRMVTAEYELKHDDQLKAKVTKAIGKEVKGSIKTLSTLEIFANEGLEKIASKVEKPLEGLKIACYYGCYLVKPPKVAHIDDPENPQIMDKIMQALGAETVEWPYKTECCGNSLVFSAADIVLKINRDIIQMAKDAGANCIVTPCPLCQPNLDMRQSQINKKYGTDYHLPIFYFTELMALALGVHKNTLNLSRHYVDPSELLKSF